MSPSILTAIGEANRGFQSSYGSDDYSSQLQEAFSILFEREVHVFLTNTGTAANSLALSALVRPYKSILCSQEAHIFTDECGAPELYTGGSQLITVDGALGKIKPEALERQIEISEAIRPHKQKPGCVSITQATEAGTVYSLEEIQAIAQCCRDHNLPLHMDGARFANALVSLEVSPSELTWKSGVDVLTFGATKNGAMCAEAVIFFNPIYAEDFDYLHKRSGQLMSKMRFFSCQFLAYLENDLWIENAQHANAMAISLASAFNRNQIPIINPVQANEVFVSLPAKVASYLEEQGAGFYSWGHVDECIYRFVTTWCTTEKEIIAFESLLEKALKS